MQVKKILRCMRMTAMLFATVFGASQCSADAPKNGDGQKPSQKQTQVAESRPKDASDASAAKSGTVTVYYFMTTYRCASCRKIEAYTHEAIQEAFAEELRNGSMAWRTLNVEEPANEHFIKDYRLYTKSVVLSDMQDGKEVRWRNLEKVWQLLGDETAFKAYITKEVTVFVKGGKS